jgi:NAD(P)-dependent dehydrogenase (short-subunit alcohol dehydrogenase family)
MRSAAADSTVATMLETLFSMRSKVLQEREAHLDVLVNNAGAAPSKAALHQLTRILATELADSHIRVNAIAPGRFYSKMTEYLSSDEPAYEREIAGIPLHRWGSASDIAGVALLLATRAGAFITGQIIAVDGGTSLVH